MPILIWRFTWIGLVEFVIFDFVSLTIAIVLHVGCICGVLIFDLYVGLRCLLSVL